MAKTFEEDESLVELANKVITEHKLDYMNSVIARYIFVVPNISKTVHGKCIRANNELKFFGKFDYLIEFSKEIWNSIDDKTKEILMYHELLHVLVKTSKGQMVPSIAGHDLQDFYAVISKYGPDWFKDFKDIVAATYELQGLEKDKITV
jgi:predicted metallopeptidase